MKYKTSKKNKHKLVILETLLLLSIYNVFKMTFKVMLKALHMPVN